MNRLWLIILSLVLTAIAVSQAEAQPTTVHSDAKTFSEQATFTKGFKFPASQFEVVAGAGTTVADAAALSATKFVHQLTGANNTVGWKFSASLPIGSLQILLNTTAGVAKIYAESGGTVNGGAADAAFSALTGIKPIICFKTAAATYICA